MRVRRRTTLAIIAVVALLAASVGTATAKGKPDKPKPSSAAPIAVSIDAVPVWVHEGDDLIRYEVTLENKTSVAIDGVSVEFTAAGVTEPVDVGTLSAGASTTITNLARYVREFVNVPDECGYGEECPLVAIAEVMVGEGNVVTQAEMSTLLLPDLPCDFVYTKSWDELQGWVIEGIAPTAVDRLCIWTLPDWNDAPTTGVWEITVMPLPPDNEKRPISVSVTVRDGVPGNWCTRWIGTPSGFSETWKWNDDPDNVIDGQVYLPGTENLLDLAAGMCLGGGHGGDYFAVGNPKSFYLATDGNVSVRWISEVPGPQTQS